MPVKLLCVGGGSGGHVTPVLAVINELATQQPDLSVTFVTDSAFLAQTEKIMKRAAVPVDVKTIAAGKFRRYMDIPLWKQVLRPDVGGRNFVDMFKVAGGVAQSIRLLRRLRPDVVFAKGGYVSLPVGYAAHLLRIPLVTHDSDARPGLANRVLSRWATYIATGTPVKNYRYNVEHTRYTGVPVDSEFRPYSDSERSAAKESFGFSPDRPLVVVTGGGLGAKDINQAMVAVAPQLLEAGYAVYHVTGKAQFHDIVKQIPTDDRYNTVPFVYEGLPRLYGAADIIVTRASATTLQEVAASARPAIIVPNSSLGDQLENAKAYQEAGAAIMLRDETLASTPALLFETIRGILQSSVQANGLVEAISAYARPDAAKAVAELILEARKK